LSSVERAAREVKLLKDEEWKTLLGLERASMSYGFGDEGMISRLCLLPVERVRFALDRLSKKRMVLGRSRNSTLTREGVEALALREYVRRDVIAALGAIIAKGKESDVYEALSEEGTTYALKFFKLGRVSFTRARKKRFIERAELRSWLTLNYEAAKREYSSLRALEGLSEGFPKVVSYNRSTVLLEELSGVRLSTRPELSDAHRVLEKILRAVREAFLSASLINADLSEYNILTDGERVWLIDWPQAVGTSHPNSVELLRHDVVSVVKFFGRAYDVVLDEERAIEYVTGRAEGLE
jgi:RIO kinase 2